MRHICGGSGLVMCYVGGNYHWWMLCQSGRFAVFKEEKIDSIVEANKSESTVLSGRIIELCWLEGGPCATLATERRDVSLCVSLSLFMGIPLVWTLSMLVTLA